MTEPRRLLDEASGLDRAILESSRDDEPSPARRRRVVAALGGASLAVSSSAAAASWKIIVGIAVVTGLGIGGAMVQARRTRPASVVAPTASVAPSVLRVATVAPVVTPAQAGPSTSAAIVVTPPPKVMAKKVAAPSPSAPSIAHEIELIDRARQAKANGDAKGALAALDEYDAECRGGALSLEAAVLRIESLAAGGDHERAATLARQFLETHPQSAYDARVRAHLPNP